MDDYKEEEVIVEFLKVIFFKFDLQLFYFRVVFYDFLGNYVVIFRDCEVVFCFDVIYVDIFEFYSKV